MTEPQKPETSFIEHQRAPSWIFAFLGLLLGVTSGLLTAVGIRNFGDDPLLTGSEVAIFFPCFAGGVIGIVYVMLNSTLMETKTTEQGLTVRLGLMGTQRTFTWETIRAIRTAEHSLARHGGRGNPFAPSSRRAWTMYGVRNGVELEIFTEAGTQIVFVSSKKADELVKAVSERS